MTRKFLLLAAAAAFFAISTHAQTPAQKATPQQDQQEQQAPKVHSVTGKVTQVETGGKAFSMDVKEGEEKRPMRFVVDKNTTVQGHVAAGSTASVDYQPDSNGQNVALSVKEESQQQQQPQ
jgi:hypothetical protein